MAPSADCSRTRAGLPTSSQPQQHEPSRGGELSHRASAGACGARRADRARPRAPRDPYRDGRDGKDAARLAHRRGVGGTIQEWCVRRLARIDHRYPVRPADYRADSWGEAG